MKVLVADSCAAVCWAYRTFLQEELPAATVFEVQDAADLLAQVNGVCPDLVLVEWELPGEMAGRLLAALRVRTPRIPVIVVSQRAECREMALAAGAEAFVWKASAPEQLRSAVQSAIGADRRPGSAPAPR